MTVDINLIKQLREETGAGIADCRKALEEAEGNIDKAKEVLRKKGMEKADKKSDRAMGSGLVYAYIHGTGQIGALVEISCETDFVAKNEDFQSLCKEVAMQVASMNPADVAELLDQAYIRDSKKTIGELVKERIAKIGENMAIRRFSRFAVSE